MNFDNIDLRRYKKYLPFVIGGVCLLLFGGIYLVHASSVPDVEEIDDIVIDNESKTEVTLDDNDEKILVDVKGAVVYPGVYQLSMGSSVQDAINIAGGLLENANTNVINLSKRVFDEMVIIIYTNEEIDAYKASPEIVTEFVYVELPCECPDTMNDACINMVETEEKQEQLISINTATKEELMTLNGIGESKAEAIIQYREENGSFSMIEDIMNVSGFGESVFEKIKNNITI